MTIRQTALLLAAAGVSLSAMPAHAAPGGPLHTLEVGKWFCEMPGDAETIATPVPAESFKAVPDSSYQMDDGSAGTYLLLGKSLVLTSGPRKGERFELQSDATLLKVGADGEKTGLRCVRAGDPAANLIEPNPTTASPHDQPAPVTSPSP